MTSLALVAGFWSCAWFAFGEWDLSPVRSTGYLQCFVPLLHPYSYNILLITVDHRHRGTVGCVSLFKDCIAPSGTMKGSSLAGSFQGRFHSGTLDPMSEVHGVFSDLPSKKIKININNL